MLVLATAGVRAEPGPLALPLPGGAPQSIDFARDPLLAFGRRAATAAPFLASLGDAVAKHPAVAGAIADQAVAAAVKVQVRAALLPRVDTQLLYNNALARDFGDRTALVESLQPRTRSDLNLLGEQLVFDFGATGNRIAAASERVLVARAEVERVAADTALRAVTAWYDVLGYQTLADLGVTMAARQRSILGDVNARVAQGVGAASDTARAEAVLAASMADSARFERQLGQARARYREAFGAEAPARLSRADPPRSIAASLEAAQSLAHQVPETIIARHAAEAARRDYRGERAAGLPRLSVGVSGTRYDVFSASDYEIRGSVVLRQSLSAGGRQRGLIAEARARSDSADFAAERVTGESERDAEAAYTDVAALTRTVATLETAYVANRRVRDAYVEQYRVSRGSLIELLRAERDFFEAATGYIQGVIALDVARYTLLARTGEILPVIGIVPA